MIQSRFLPIPVNAFYFFGIFIMSESYFLCLYVPCFSFHLHPAILFFHLLDIVNAAAGHVCGGGGVVVCFARSVDCSNILGVELSYDIICVIL